MDGFKHRGQRRQLIKLLRESGQFDEKVLEVMANVPRHVFMNSSFAEYAYQDKPWPIACEQTISQPSTVARQTTALRLLPRQKVLEIGTGSGYQAAVLSLLGGRVFSVERHEPLWKQAKLTLKRLRLNHVRCFLRDGQAGLPEFAPFQRILVTAAAPEVPNSLLEQLEVGGLLVIPVGPADAEQRLLRIERLAGADYQTEDLGSCAFVPFLPGLVD
ncbi:MAG: protein-L-isoaspartate(D-aspartate) O-methyltransferase [Bacteroidota bacterium]